VSENPPKLSLSRALGEKKEEGPGEAHQFRLGGKPPSGKKNQKTYYGGRGKALTILCYMKEVAGRGSWKGSLFLESEYRGGKGSILLQSKKKGVLENCLS